MAPSITLTCTLMVSPGLNAGMSSRNDGLSTKSSRFIGNDHPWGRGVVTPHTQRAVVTKPVGSGLLVHLAAGGTQPGRPPRQTTAQLCQTVRMQ
ncbi:Uncharacterised protein [Mycobacterium tuberculosis]|nr:Uncharacterised protein [Mycobacterium tuberculosis]